MSQNVKPTGETLNIVMETVTGTNTADAGVVDELLMLWLARQDLLAEYDRLTAAESAQAEEIGKEISGIEERIGAAPATTLAGLMVQALLLSKLIAVEDAEWSQRLAMHISAAAGSLAAEQRPTGSVADGLSPGLAGVFDVDLGPVSEDNAGPLRLTDDSCVWKSDALRRWCRTTARRGVVSD